MLRDVALLAVIAVTATFAQNDGAKQEPDSFDVEPPLLIPNRDDASLPGPDADFAKLEKDVDRAKRNAVGAERLCKIGAISKLEAEQRALHVVRLESDLANSRLERAKEQAAALQSRVAGGEAVGDELEGAKTELARLTEAAQTATDIGFAGAAEGEKFLLSTYICFGSVDLGAFALCGGGLCGFS